MIIQSSWDDGSEYDYYLCSLLKKYNIPGIFYIPTNNDLRQSEIKEISKDFEIGGHTVTHPRDMKLLSEENQFNEIKENKEYLEQLIGKEINSFCYPRGKYNEITSKMVEKAGFKEARTTCVLCIDDPIDRYRKHTTIHVRPDRPEYDNQHWLVVAKELFNIAKKKDGYYHIWGHGWEIEKFQQWQNLEILFKYINKNL